MSAPVQSSSAPATAEETLARRLAHTDKAVRDAAFATVGAWLSAHAEADEEDDEEDDEGDSEDDDEDPDVDEAVSAGAGAGAGAGARQAAAAELAEAEEEAAREVAAGHGGAGGAGATAPRRAEVEMMKLWKALFYCVWMSDKPTVQQELVGAVARLVRLFEAEPLPVRASAEDAERRRRRLASGLLFLRCCFATLSREWLGLDRYRVDKFLSLLRLTLREALRFCRPSAVWDGAAAEGVAAVLGLVMSSRATPSGVRLHLADCFADELCVSLPGLTAPQLLLLARPMLHVLRQCDAPVVFERVAAAVWGGSGPGGAVVVVGAGTGLLRRLLAPADLAAAEAGVGPAAVGAGAPDADVDAPLRAVDAAAVARALFEVGADAATRAGHRERVYALHRVWARAALRLGHAKDEAATYPRALAAAAFAVRAPEPAPAPGVKTGGKKAGEPEASRKKARRRALLLEQQLARGDDDEGDDDGEDEERTKRARTSGGGKSRAKSGGGKSGGGKIGVGKRRPRHAARREARVVL